MKKILNELHLWTLLALSLAMAPKAADAQVAPDKLPKDKIRIELKATPKIVIENIDYKTYADKGYMAFYLPESNEIHFYKVTFEEWQNFLFFKFKTKYSVSTNNKINYRHEWNHYKNMLFGSLVRRLNPEEAFLLALFDEVSSQFYDNINFSKRLAKRSNKMSSAERQAYFQSIKPDVVLDINSKINKLLSSDTYKRNFIGIALRRYDVNPNYGDKEDYKHDVYDIIRDMFMFYSDEFSVNENSQLNSTKMLTSGDIKFWADKILSDPDVQDQLIAPIRAKGIDLGSLDKNTKFINLSNIKGLAEMDSLDLSHLDSLREVNSIDVKVPKYIKFPSGIQEITIMDKGLDMSGIKKWDMGYFDKLTVMHVLMKALPKIIVLPKNLNSVIFSQKDGDESDIVLDISHLEDDSPMAEKIRENGYKTIQGNPFNQGITTLKEAHVDETSTSFLQEGLMRDRE